MSDDEDDDGQPFYAPGRRSQARKEQPGDKVWELRKGDRRLVCELRDDERAGAA